MPIKPENRKRYPDDWKEISRRIRFDRAKGFCEFCGAEHGRPHPITGSKVILTTAHLNHIPEDCRDENLAALCQRCHLAYDQDIHIKNAALSRRCGSTIDMFGVPNTSQRIEHKVSTLNQVVKDFMNNKFKGA